VARDGDMVCLAVEDDGVGFNEQASAAGTGLGSKVIASMTSRLEGTLTYQPRARGTRAALQFPL